MTSSPIGSDKKQRHEFKVANAQEASEIWEKAWNRYIEIVKEEGYEDPKRLPPPDFLQTRCDI